MVKLTYRVLLGPVSWGLRSYQNCFSPYTSQWVSKEAWQSTTLPFNFNRLGLANNKNCPLGRRIKDCYRFPAVPLTPSRGRSQQCHPFPLLPVLESFLLESWWLHITKQQIENISNWRLAHECRSSNVCQCLLVTCKHVINCSEMLPSFMRMRWRPRLPITPPRSCQGVGSESA